LRPPVDNRGRRREKVFAIRGRDRNIRLVVGREQRPAKVEKAPNK
jgi:hypothetical protein